MYLFSLHKKTEGSSKYVKFLNVAAPKQKQYTNLLKDELDELMTS